jgi:hypothetical protein
MKRKLEVECMSFGDLSNMTITFYKCGCWIQTKQRPSYTELMFMKFLKRLRLPHPRSHHRIILDSYLCIKHELEQNEEAMKEWKVRMSKE